jgi:hypothetical protein
MPYSLFICHAYRHSRLYNLLRGRLINAKHFSFRNESIPEDMTIDGMSDADLLGQIRMRIARSDVVLAFTTLAATHSTWIREELRIARELGKPIIAITPNNARRRSQLVIDMADVHVEPWRVDSVINAIREAHRRRPRQPTAQSVDTVSERTAERMTSVRDVVGRALHRTATPDAVGPVPTPDDGWFRPVWVRGAGRDST